ncbi:MAG: hypothetical protein CVU14_11920 [Bacteroidetes bacterium HGW-Bacteroidetes-9]|jgi:hypothetical protein|nr:MAG: hypothetical protein CVU14_11920 [Bacteroidetes bacterium HGW-Bacteroidetes-9]
MAAERLKNAAIINAAVVFILCIELFICFHFNSQKRAQIKNYQQILTTSEPILNGAAKYKKGIKLKPLNGK